jgi:hypothetical protein
VRPEIWARTEELTDGTDRNLTAHLVAGGALQVPVRHTAAGETVGAISDQGIAVFMAGDPEALGNLIGRYLADFGFLRDPADLRAELVAPVPPERLDPDSIWTGAPSGFGAEANKELSDQETTHEDQEVSTT